MPESGDYSGRVLVALAREFLRNPARRSDWRQFYRAFRGMPPLPLGDDEWIVTQWEDVRAVMCHESAELISLYPSTKIPDINRLFLGMLPHESGAEHRRLRALTQAAFTSSAVAHLEKSLMEAVAELLYPAAFTPGGCDVYGTVGLGIPERLSCLLLDVDPDDQRSVIQWSHMFYREIGRYDQSANRFREVTEEYAAFRDYVLRRAREPRGETSGGVAAHLFHAHENHDLGDDQLVCYFTLFLLAGQDTISYALSNSVCFLGSSPEVFASLRCRPELAGAAFAEAMRLWGPIRLCVRTMTAPLVTSRASIPEGSRVFALIHAANRDSRHIDHPDEFRWDRSSRQSMAFGVGPHGCLGGALGALVGRILFASLSTRCTALRVTPGLEDAGFVSSLPILGIEGVRLFAGRAT